MTNTIVVTTTARRSTATTPAMTTGITAYLRLGNTSVRPHSERKRRSGNFTAGESV
jgi:hypothetical protein